MTIVIFALLHTLSFAEVKLKKIPVDKKAANKILKCLPVLENAFQLVDFNLFDLPIQIQTSRVFQIYSQKGIPYSFLSVNPELPLVIKVGDKAAILKINSNRCNHLVIYDNATEIDRIAIKIDFKNPLAPAYIKCNAVEISNLQDREVKGVNLINKESVGNILLIESQGQNNKDFEDPSNSSSIIKIKDYKFNSNDFCKLFEDCINIFSASTDLENGDQNIRFQKIKGQIIKLNCNSLKQTTYTNPEAPISSPQSENSGAQ
jgi:hypothetical protein